MQGIYLLWKHFVLLGSGALGCNNKCACYGFTNRFVVVSAEVAFYHHESTRA